MKRPKPTERRPAASPGPQSVDETMIDISRPAGQGSVGQQAGRSTVQVAVATDVGRVRRNNEDYVQAERVVRDGRRYSMWAVADGVGGGPQGELASKTAVETIVDYLAHEPWTDPSVALTEAFALANRNVFEITGEGSAASTMVAALVSEPEGVVCIANVGDSRAYIVTGGEARQITDDHSVVAARVAAGQITAAEARTAPDRNVLTRSIGSETEVLVDIFGPRQLQPNERLVLCTDGVHGMIDDDAIGRLGGGLPIAESAGALVAAAVEAGGKDNATALVGGFGAAGALLAAAPLAAASAVRAGKRPPGLAIGAAAVAIVVVALLAVLAFGVFAASPTPTPSLSPSPTASPRPSATPAPTAAPIAEPTVALTAAPRATRTQGQQAAPTHSPTPTATPTPTPTPMPIPTPTPTPTPPAPMTVDLVVAPPLLLPDNGTFTVTSTPEASCVFATTSGGASLTPVPPTVALDKFGVGAEDWGLDWGAVGAQVTAKVTCTELGAHGRIAHGNATVTWP